MNDLAGPLALIALAYYAALSLLSLVVYAVDKRAAKQGAWRIKERTMHTIDLLGGWPGGLLGQRVFKHKRRKTAYMLVFWAGVGAHALVWGVVVYFWLTG